MAFREVRVELRAKLEPRMWRLTTSLSILACWSDSDSALDSVVSTHRAGRPDATTLASFAESATILQARKITVSQKNAAGSLGTSGVIEKRFVMRLAAKPENLKESVALAAGLVPTPLIDTFVALLLAKTVIAATAVGIFDALETAPLTAAEIAKRCESDPKATEQLLRALFACKYLKLRGNRFVPARASRRWLSRTASCSLHSAVLHRGLDLRFMNFEEYVKSGKSLKFHAALSPEDWGIYHEGQAGHAAQVLGEVIGGIPLPPHAKDLLDLGGGHGLYSFAFCRRYPSLQARVLDLDTTVGRREAKSMPSEVSGRVQFEVADIRTVPLPPNSCDVILLANVVHHLDDATNRELMRRSAVALRPGGIAIVIDAVRPLSLQETGQLEGLLDLYFGAASGVGLRPIEDIREWMLQAALTLCPPKTLRRMPICKMQVARKVG